MNEEEKEVPLTLIKPMNEEEKEAPLEDPHVRRNCLARERHAPDLK
jgi:hypothetical protein